MGDGRLVVGARLHAARCTHTVARDCRLAPDVAVWMTGVEWCGRAASCVAACARGDGVVIGDPVIGDPPTSACTGLVSVCQNTVRSDAHFHGWCIAAAWLAGHFLSAASSTIRAWQMQLRVAVRAVLPELPCMRAGQSAAARRRTVLPRSGAGGSLIKADGEETPTVLEIKDPISIQSIVDHARCLVADCMMRWYSRRCCETKRNRVHLYSLTPMLAFSPARWAEHARVKQPWLTTCSLDVEPAATSASS